MECKYLYYMYSTLISLTLFPSSLSPCLSLLPSLPPSFPPSLSSILPLQPVPSPDFVVTVEIDNIQHQVYVQKRPHVDEFLQRMGEMFECVLFTASLSKVSLNLMICKWHYTPLPFHCVSFPQYADPVADLLDKWNTFDARLFRESCVFHKGNYVKASTCVPHFPVSSVSLSLSVFVSFGFFVSLSSFKCVFSSIAGPKQAW